MGSRAHTAAICCFTSVAAEKSRHRYPRLSKLWPKKHGDMISHNKVLYDKPGWLWWRFKRRPWEHPSNMFRRLWKFLDIFELFRVLETTSTLETTSAHRPHDPTSETQGAVSCRSGWNNVTKRKDLRVSITPGLNTSWVLDLISGASFFFWGWDYYFVGAGVDEKWS